MLAGERFGVREPGKKRKQHRNNAQMFYTAFGPLTYTNRNSQKAEAYNLAMGERFKMRPLPLVGRYPKSPQCACCFAGFLLHNASR